MRCFVTGASGHLGSYLTKCLLDHGEEVSVLVRPQSNLWRLSEMLDRIDILRADLTDLRPVQKAVMDRSPEVVFHLAWSGTTKDTRNDPDQIYQNLLGSLNLFRLLQAAGCQCWIGLGSQAEYGHSGAVLKESLPPQPVTAYGVAKLCVGLLTQRLSEISKIRHVWFRLSAVYGPKGGEAYLIPTVIRRLLLQEAPMLTWGEQKWDYLYVEDGAEALYQAAINTKLHGIYNLSSGEIRTIRQIVESIRNQIDPSLPLEFGTVPYPPEGMRHLEVDSSRFRKDAGWSPQTKLGEGLQRTIDWYRRN